jgi:hypothetical protein
LGPEPRNHKKEADPGGSRRAPQRGRGQVGAQERSRDDGRGDGRGQVGAQERRDDGQCGGGQGKGHGRRTGTNREALRDALRRQESFYN